MTKDTSERQTIVAEDASEVKTKFKIAIKGSHC